MRKKILGVLIFGIVAFLVNPHAILRAATPEFLITWRAQSYVPPYYTGKALPSAGSSLVAALELVENGRLIDLSQETITWQLDRELIGNGIGLQTVTFQAKDLGGGAHNLRARINNFRDQSIIVLKTIEIPVADPEAVIENRFPGATFGGSRVRVTGYPYFFNIQNPTELSYSWNVNGQKPATLENPSVLDVNIDGTSGQQSLEVKLTIKNPQNILESASRLLKLFTARP